MSTNHTVEPEVAVMLEAASEIRRNASEVPAAARIETTHAEAVAHIRSWTPIAARGVARMLEAAAQDWCSGTHRSQDALDFARTYLRRA